MTKDASCEWKQTSQQTTSLELFRTKSREGGKQVRSLCVFVVPNCFCCLFCHLNESVISVCSCVEGVPLYLCYQHLLNAGPSHSTLSDEQRLAVVAAKQLHSQQ